MRTSDETGKWPNAYTLKHFSTLIVLRLSLFVSKEAKYHVNALRVFTF